MNSKQMYPCGIDPSNDKVRPDVALVAEQVLFKECHTCHNAWLTAGGQRVELEVGGDKGGGKFCASGGVSVVCLKMRKTRGSYSAAVPAPVIEVSVHCYFWR